MKIKTLSLVNFRNFNELNLSSISEGINIISAPNASGKSNLLESIYMLSLGASPRTSNGSEVIKWNEKFARISTKVGDDDIALFIKRSNKTFLINGKKSSIKDLRSRILVVYFHPPGLTLFSGSPTNRRRFLNRLIAQLDISYIYSLSSYTKLLTKRNSMLKKDQPNEVIFLSIEEEMAKLASILILTRALVVQAINKELAPFGMTLRYKHSPQSLREIIREFLQEISAEKVIIPSATANQTFGNYSEIVREKFLESLKKMREKEMLLGFSLFGPQRDDFRFYLKDEMYPDELRDVGRFGSRGEQRMSVIRLKLVESRLISQHTKLVPILLFDDIFSELDEANRELVYEIMQQHQSFLTTAEELRTIRTVIDGANLIKLK